MKPLYSACLIWSWDGEFLTFQFRGGECLFVTQAYSLVAPCHRVMMLIYVDHNEP